MKFGVLLRESAADVPELQALYGHYKALKKRLKQLPERGAAGAPADRPAAAAAAEREAAFVRCLNEDVQAFNDLFMEREEEHIIRLSSLEDAAAGAVSAEQVHPWQRREACPTRSRAGRPLRAQCLLASRQRRPTCFLLLLPLSRAHIACTAVPVV